MSKGRWFVLSALIVLTVSAVPSTAFAAADLTVTNTSAPYSGSTAHAGSSFTVRCTLNNIGDKFVNKTFTLRYYYCPGQSTSSCTSVGSSTISTNIAAGATLTVTSGSLTLPTTARLGTGYIRFFADSAYTINEDNETNNNTYDPITVTTKPDLSITSATVPYSGSTAAGGCSFTVRYVLKNASSTSYFSTDFAVRYLYCPTATTTGCTTLDTATVTNNFSSGESYTHTSPSLTLPGTVTTGTHYIRVVVDVNAAVDEGDETNNAQFDPIDISGQTDLSFGTTTAPNSGSTAGAGSSFTVRAVIESSCVPVSTDFVLDYYYCDYNNSSSCTKLGSSNVTHDFTSNDSFTVTSGSLTLPNTVRQGTRYIRFHLDAGSAVTETDEGNNNDYDSITVSTYPDLSITGATVPATGDTDGPGSTFTATHTNRNASGTSYFSTDHVVRYYYCPSNSSTTGCIQLATHTCTNNYSAGETHTHTSPTLTLPATVMPGTRYLRAVVDADDQVTEGDETNNDHYAAITVVTGNPDLYISQFSANVAGTTVMFAVTVCNQGADTTQDLSLALYFNPSSAPDCSTTADHTWTIAGGLGNGACATRNYQRNNVATGVYMAWARADHACALSETDENNNNKSAPYAVGTVLPDMGPDLGPDGSLDAEPPDALVVDAVPTDFIEPFDAPPGSESVTQQDATGPGKEGWFWPDTGSTDATTGGTAEGGCGCRVDGDPPRGSGSALLALALALLLLIRRRRY